MEDHENEKHQELKWDDRAPNATTRWLVIVSVVLFAAAIFGVGYAYEQSETVTSLNQQNQLMRAAETQMRGQIDTLTAKISTMAAPPQDAAANATPAGKNGDNDGPAAGKSAVKHSASSGSSLQARRTRQIQAQLTEQQKLLKQTQDEIASAKADLEGQLGSTRDELTGSI